MANHKSAAKRTRQTERRTAVNRNRISRVRTFVRKVEEAIKAGDVTVAAEALKVCQPELMKAASKGVVKKNAAARKVSRFAQRIKKLAA